MTGFERCKKIHYCGQEGGEGVCALSTEGHLFGYISSMESVLILIVTCYEKMFVVKTYSLCDCHESSAKRDRFYFFVIPLVCYMTS